MRNIAFILFVFVTSFSWSQQIVFDFKGQVDNLDIGKREAGVTVSIIQGGTTVASTTTASNGKYALKSPVSYRTPFKVVFSKAGFVSKFVQFNLSALNEEDIPAGTDFRPVEDLSMSLFKNRDNVDFSFLNTQPVASFDWNTRNLTVNLDQVESTRVSKQILDLLDKAEKDKAQAEIKYQDAIKKADAFYNSKSYEKALGMYEEALMYKPTEKYPADKIIELDALIQANKAQELAQAQADEKYNNLITAADNLKGQGKLVEAVTKYEAALEEKNEQYPKDQIAALNKQIEDQKREAENQEKYNAAIKAADGFMKQNSMKAARDKYVEASKLKPSEQYPKDKLAELDGKLAAQAEKEAVKQKYDDAIAAGDQLFTDEKYAEAKGKYQEALAIESASTYAKGRIEMCDTKINEAKAEKERLAKIEKLLSEGNASFVASKWEEAKGKYNEVLGLDVENATAKEKLKLIDQKIEESKNLAAQEEKFKKLITEGDQANTAKKYDEAIAKYQEAIQIKESPEVNVKIEAIKKIQAELAQANERKANYDAAVEAGNNLFNEAKWEEAKAKYREAMTFDNTQTYPSQRIVEIEKLQAEAAAKDKKKAEYEAAIQAADQLFKDENWADAKSKYRDAMALDNTQDYPATKIAEIDSIQIGLADAAKKQKKYDDIITAANKLFGESEWEKAKAKYKEAIAVDDTQSLPAERIAEIDKIQAEAKALAEKKANYDAAVKAADDLFAKEKYADAKSKYQEALSIDASQAYPNDKIAEIDKVMGNKAAEAERKAKYDAAIEAGNQLFGSEKWNEAKAKYTEAIAIDSAPTYPKDKIAEIDKKIAAQGAAEQKKEEYNALISAADGLFAQSKWEDAKAKYKEALAIDAAEVYPVEKIAEIDNKLSKMAQVNALLAEGKSLFDQNKLKDALSKYQEVLAIDGNKTAAKTQIEAINAKLSAQDSEAEKLANFNKLKTEGYALADQKDYPGAINKLEQALQIKSDQEVKTKIDELNAVLTSLNEKKGLEEKYNALMADGEAKTASNDYSGAINKYKEALTLKPSEALPKQKIADLEALIRDANAQKATDEKYQAAMKKGDDLMSQKRYLDAIQEYNNALTIKPDEQEPVDKAAEAERLEKAKGSDVDEQYEKILTVAQTKIESKEYTKAIELLNRAISLKPGDTRPQELLNEIAELQRQDAVYNDLMKKGDALASSKKYEEAKSKYQEALAAKPLESEPKDKIEEMDRLISESSSAEETEKLYNEYMRKGDSERSSKEYVMALSQFQNALSVKPGDVAAHNKIKEIQQILDDIANSQAANVELMNKFNALVKDADGQFAAEDYLKAKSIYEEALQLIPSNSYVAKQIEECVMLERRKSNMERDREYQKIIDVADKNFMMGDYEKSRDYFKRASGLRVNDPYPRKKLAEIDAILNPVVVDSGKLEDLGDPYDNSIMDGQALLLKAEEERKLIKKTKIQRKQNKISESESELTTAKTQQHYDNTNEIYQVQMQITRDAGESDLGRQLTVDALRQSELELQEVDRTNLNFEQSENQTDQQAISTVVKNSAIVYGEKEVVYQENTDKMNRYRTVEANADTEKNRANYISNIDSDQTITGVRIQVEENTIESDKYRVGNTELIKVENKELADANVASYNGEMEKYLKNKSKIEYEVNANTGIEEIAKEAHVKKVDYVNTMDKKAMSQNVEAHKGDLEERQDATKSIHNVYAGIQTKAKDEAEKQEVNSNKLVDVNKTLQASDANRNIGQQEKHYDNMAELSKVANTPIKHDKVANSLGEEYPEGVSQESFTQNDQDGLMKAIITRRIVVINGHADVYVRTQTLNGITYSKNGTPSLSHVWQKETQDPSLKRHY